MEYNIYKDEELVDILDLTDEEVIKYKKSNPEFQLFPFSDDDYIPDFSWEEGYFDSDDDYDD